ERYEKFAVTLSNAAGATIDANAASVAATIQDDDHAAAFAQPTFELAAFAPTSGWSSNDAYPRVLADVNGDHMADIVGFGQYGANVALAAGGGHFAAPTSELATFAVSSGWANNDQYPRMLADVNGDHMADIVGFGTA